MAWSLDVFVVLQSQGKTGLGSHEIACSFVEFEPDVRMDLSGHLPAGGQVGVFFRWCDWFLTVSVEVKPSTPFSMRCQWVH